MKCPICGKTAHIERWPCSEHSDQYSPYNDDQLYCRSCGHREMVEKGLTPDGWD